MSLRNMEVQYIGDTLYLPTLEREVKHIVVRKDANDLVHFVSIVRCNDCKYYEPNIYRHFTCELLQFRVEPNSFCAWGELDDARDIQ